MEPFRLEITPALANHMAYDKFRSDPIRLLILEGDYWIDRACARAAEAMGWDVVRCPVKMVGTMPREMLKELFNAIVTHRPDFVLSVNLSGMDVDGMLAGFLADLKIPHATWFVDGPRAIMAGNHASATDYAVAYTWEPAYVEYLEGCGFGGVYVSPLAVDETLFNQEPVDIHPHPPSFVGDSMVQHAAREWPFIEQIPSLKAAVECAFEAGRVDRQLFSRGVEAILGDGADAFSADDLHHAERIFFIEGTRRLRHELAVQLGPHGLHVRGDRQWEEVTPDFGPPLGYFDELAPFYRDCSVNLNTTSVQMATAVNQRVFDCPAAGGFLLTDEQGQLGELFDQEKEIVGYSTLEEARELMTWFLDRPGARREIIEHAQRRIFGEHTYRHRLDRIAEQMKAIYGA
jgi:spore maturation protein CgeB